MAEINVERKSNPWPWIIGLIVLALVVWAAFEMMGDDVDDAAYIGNDTAVIAPADGYDNDVGVDVDVDAEVAGPDMDGADPLATGATRVFFPLDHAVLTNDARAELNEVANDVRGDTNREIVLQAYTDTTGTRAYNEELSEQRGEAVRQYLIEQGVDASRITVQPYGESNELNETRDGVIAEDNRRVTIVFGDEI